MKNKILALSAILIPSLIHGSVVISGTAITRDPSSSAFPDINVGQSYGVRS